MAYKFTAQATGATDDDIIYALKMILVQIQGGFTSGGEEGHNRDYNFDLSEAEAD